MTEPERHYTVTPDGRRYAIGDSQPGGGGRRLPGGLTAWQVRILRTVADGLSAQEAGQELFLSVNTIRTHRRRIYQALGARNAAHAVAIGYRLGLLKP